MAVEIRDLCKSFDGLSVCDHFNFTIEEGVVTAITGPSGCGKTTFLRMLAGLEEPDSGTIERTIERGGERGERRGEGHSGECTAQAGTAANAFGQPCGKTAVVFQEDRLLPWLTVKENLRLVLESTESDETSAAHVTSGETDLTDEELASADGERTAAAGAAEKQKRDQADADGETAAAVGETGRWTLEGMIHFMGLSGFEDYYPEALSGGMKRRVAIGRALLYGGDILLMDEPFKGLDDELKQDIMKVLAEEWKRSKSTVVLITHDREDAAALADRLWEFAGRPLRAVPAAACLRD